MGHKNFPTGDAVALCQRKSNVVDIFFKGSSERSIRHRKEREKEQVTLIGKENSHWDCSPAVRVVNTALNKSHFTRIQKRTSKGSDCSFFTEYTAIYHELVQTSEFPTVTQGRFNNV